MKQLIKPIIGTSLGLLCLILCVFGYPSKWFIHGTIGSLDTYTLIYLVNAAIFSIIVPVIMFLLGYFKTFAKDIFVKYGIIFILSILIGLLGQFFGHFQGYGYIPDFGMIFFGALLGNFLRNFSEIISLALLIKSVSLLFEFKYKTLILTIASSIIYGVLMLIYHIGYIPLAISMYVFQGFGIGILTGYLVLKENSLLSPAIFFGIYGFTLLPNYFALNSAIQTPTRIVLIILYILILLFFAFMLIYDILKQRKEEKAEKEKLNNIKNELKQNDLFTKEGIEEYLNKL